MNKIKKGIEKMKRFFIAGLAFWVLALTQISVAGAENENIIGVEIIGGKLMIFTDFPVVSGESVQIGNTECEISSYGDIRESGIAAETLILIDASASVNADSRVKINDILLEMIVNKPSGDSFSIMAFGEQATVISDFTSDGVELIRSIGSIDYSGGEGYLYSSISQAVDIMSRRQTGAFKRIAVISQGREVGREGITLAEIQRNLEESGLPIYTLWAGENEQGLKRLTSLSRVTNAVVGDIDTYENVYDAIISYDGYSIVTSKIPEMLMDGGTKRLRLSAQTSSGSTEIFRDIRLPMGNAAPANAEDQPDNTNEDIAESPSTIASVIIPQNNAQSEDKTGFYIAVVIIAVVTAVAIVLIIYYVGSKKSKKLSNPVKEETVKPTEEVIEFEKTEFIKEELPAGNTEWLIAPTELNETVFKLTDENDPFNMFQSDIGQGVIIGKSAENCMIAITHEKSISRKHCRIFKIDELVYIEDLNSANGTFVNGKKITEKTVLNSNDKIKLGRVILRFEILF